MFLFLILYITESPPNSYFRKQNESVMVHTGEGHNAYRNIVSQTKHRRLHSGLLVIIARLLIYGASYLGLN
jgi:hypothetical protein